MAIPGGGVYVKRLVELLGFEQPLYSVDPHGINNGPIPETFEAMATDLLPAIIAAQPKGPYRLCGYCTGGLVAFETARILMASGREVERVMIIDAPTLNARRWVQFVLSIFNCVGGATDGIIELSAARTWYFLARLDRFFYVKTAGKARQD